MSSDVIFSAHNGSPQFSFKSFAIWSKYDKGSYTTGLFSPSYPLELRMGRTNKFDRTEAFKDSACIFVQGILEHTRFVSHFSSDI